MITFKNCTRLEELKGKIVGVDLTYSLNSIPFLSITLQALLPQRL